MLKILISISILTFSFSANADLGDKLKKKATAAVSKKLNIKQRKKLKYWNGELVKNQRYVKRACGVEVPTVVDGSMADTFIKENKSASGYCQAVVAGVQDHCGDEEIRATVLEKIKRVNCILNPKNPKALDFAIKSGTLTATMGSSASNINKKSREWIENNL